MTGDKVGRVETHLDDLDDEFSSGLRERMRSQSSVEPNTLNVSSGHDEG